MSPHQDSSQRSNALREKGFTLIEVLVAFTLLTTALVPAFVVAGSAAGLSTSIRNTLVSANLAQEGIEVVRAIRDDNWFAGKSFDDGLNGCSAGCAVQYDSAAPLTGGQEKTFLQQDSTGAIQYGSGKDTIYKRVITVTSEPPRMKVVSTVSWKERSTDKSVSLEYYLFDWKQ